MIARARASCRRACRRRRRFRRSNPADSPILFLTLSSATLPLLAGRSLRGNGARASGCRWSPAWRRSTSSARRSSRSASTSIRRSSPSRQIGIDQVAQAISAANVNRPTGTLYGPSRNFVVAGAGPADGRGRLPAVVVAYRNGSPVRLEEVAQRLRRRREPAQRAAGTTAPGDLPGDPAAARHQHRGGGGRDQGAAPAAPRRSCRRRIKLAHPERSLDLDPRVGRRREVHAAADGRSSSCS